MAVLVKNKIVKKQYNGSDYYLIGGYLGLIYVNYPCLKAWACNSPRSGGYIRLIDFSPIGQRIAAQCFSANISTSI